MSPLVALTHAEIALAMKDSAAGFIQYRSDGSARGDSARRLGAFGMWEVEGGDALLGLRLYRAAFYLGVADSMFYRDAMEVTKLLRRDDDVIVLYREYVRRWPDNSWGWAGLAKELEKRGRFQEADEARQRASRARSACRASAQSTGEDAFCRDDWLADYSYLKLQLERQYSHLAWFGSPQGGVDLPALDRAIQNTLERASSTAEASAAITAFVAAFHDGHFAPTSPPRASSAAPGEPPVVDRAKDARTACAAFGYSPITRIAFSLPFESLEGFELVSDGLSDPFRAGVIVQGDRRTGLVRIPRFRPAEFPAVCQSAWVSLRARGIEATRDTVNEIIDAEWLRALAARLSQLQTRNISALLVDVGGNGGGNDLGDWAVRLFARAPVRSAPLLLSANHAAIPYFNEQLGDLERALRSNANLPEATRAALVRAIAEFNQRKQLAMDAPCDMGWVWREQRAWGTSSCANLIASGFASGALDYSELGTIDVRAVRALYWPAVAASFRGAWTGPTYVLTDANTGSAAEMFTALMRDRGIARTVGARTFGLGCGFMDHDTPVVLPHSGRAFNIPNCVRLRGDGTDEVAGIAPDLPMLAQPGESARSMAARTLRTIVSDTLRR